MDKIESAKPHLVIEPPRAWVPLNLGDLWQHRELLYFLVWRDLKVRYKQTAMGAAWAVMQPLFTMLIFTIFFGKFAQMPSDNLPYPLFAYAGLLPWTFFANALTNASNSLVGSSNLITKVYFPRLLMPAAAVMAGLVDFACAFLVLLLMMFWYEVPLSVNLIMLPVLLALTAALALGTGLWLAAWHVKYRDVRYLIPFLIQFWMFATPIIYPASLVPEKFRLLFSLNPMTGIIEAFRTALLGDVNGARFDWAALGIAALLTTIALVYAAFDFRRMENQFADLV